MPLNTLNVCHEVPEAACCRSALVLSHRAPQEPAAEGANRGVYEGKFYMTAHDSEPLTYSGQAHTAS